MITREQAIKGDVGPYPVRREETACPDCGGEIGGCYDQCITKLDYICETCDITIHFCPVRGIVREAGMNDHIFCQPCIIRLANHMRDYAAVTDVPLPRKSSWSLIECECSKGVIERLKPHAEKQTNEPGDDVPDVNPYCVL